MQTFVEAGRFGDANRRLRECPVERRGREYFHLRASVNADAPLADLSSQALSAEFTADGTRVASCGFGAIAGVWEVATGREGFRLTGKAASVPGLPWLPDGAREVSWSRDGSRIVASRMDGSAIVLDGATGRAVVSLRREGAMVVRAVFHPDCSVVAFAASDGSVTLFDPVSGEPAVTIPPAKAYPFSVAFRDDGSRLAVGADDGTVRIHDTRTGRVLASFASADGVSRVVWSADGARLATASGDGKCRVWTAASRSRPTADACSPRPTTAPLGCSKTA